MNEQRLVSAYTVSLYELQARQELLSRVFREREAQMLAELARKAHLTGRRFVDWPTFSSTSQDPSLGYAYGGITLRAEVGTVPS